MIKGGDSPASDNEHSTESDNQVIENTQQMDENHLTQTIDYARALMNRRREMYSNLYEEITFEQKLSYILRSHNIFPHTQTHVQSNDNHNETVTAESQEPPIVSSNATSNRKRHTPPSPGNDTDDMDSQPPNKKKAKKLKSLQQNENDSNKNKSENNTKKEIQLPQKRMPPTNSNSLWCKPTELYQQTFKHMQKTQVCFVVVFLEGD